LRGVDPMEKENIVQESKIDKIGFYE